MLNQYCLVCSDPTHFRRDVNDAIRINNNIRSILSKYNQDFDNELITDIKRQFISEHKHPHFTCGNCTKVNTMELYNLEKNLYNTLVNCMALIQTKTLKPADYHIVLTNLAGHYTRMYHELNKAWCKMNSDN